MSVSPTTASPMQPHLAPETDKPKSSLSAEVAQTIKAINTLVLTRPQILFPLDKSGEATVRIPENLAIMMEYFREIVASQDVIFLPIGTPEMQDLLLKMDFTVYHVSGKPSMIALKRTTWQTDATLTITTKSSAPPNGITILASQKDGKPVMLACCNCDDANAFAERLSWIHENYASINKHGMEDLPHWTHAIAAFHVEEPITRQCYPSAHWKWFAGGITCRGDPVFSKAKDFIGSTWLLDESSHWDGRLGLTQRQITWPRLANDSPKPDDDIYD